MSTIYNTYFVFPLKILPIKCCITHSMSSFSLECDSSSAQHLAQISSNRFCSVPRFFPRCFFSGFAAVLFFSLPLGWTLILSGQNMSLFATPGLQSVFLPGYHFFSQIKKLHIFASTAYCLTDRMLNKSKLLRCNQLSFQVLVLCRSANYRYSIGHASTIDIRSIVEAHFSLQALV